MDRDDLLWEDILSYSYIDRDGEYVEFDGLSRLKVHGGWLVGMFQSSEAGSSGLTFVPDPQHKWKVMKPEDA